MCVVKGFVCERGSRRVPSTPKVSTRVSLTFAMEKDGGVLSD